MKRAASGAACAACASTGIERWRPATSDLRLPERRTYELERCRACGTAAIVTEERSGSTEELYGPQAYGRGGSRLEPLLEPMRRLVDFDRKRLTGGLPRGGRVFEVGAGDGRLLAGLAERGHVVSGIEPAPHRSAAARARGVVVDTAALEETSLPAKSRDAVVLWHVLEHLDDPEEALRRIRAWLVPGGMLLVAVPNLASLQARIGGDRWFHQHVPRHVVHFTAQGLCTLLTRTGFDVVRVRHVALEQNLLGMWQTLLNGLTLERNAFFAFVKGSASHARRRDRVRDAAVTVVGGTLLLPVAAALELAAGLAGRGGTIVVEATLRTGAEAAAAAPGRGGGASEPP